MPPARSAATAFAALALVGASASPALARGRLSPQPPVGLAAGAAGHTAARGGPPGSSAGPAQLAHTGAEPVLEALAGVAMLLAGVAGRRSATSRG